MESEPRKGPSPRQQAIKEEMNSLQQLSRAEGIRENLAKATSDFQKDLAGMRETSDKLAGMTGTGDQQSGEMQTYLLALNDSIKQAEKTMPILNEFVNVANIIFEKSFNAQKETLSQVELAQEKESCQLELNKLKVVNKELQMNCAILKEKSQTVRASYESLEKILTKRESELKQSRLGIILQGSLCVVGSVIAVAVVVGVGITLQKRLSIEEAREVIKEAVQSKEVRGAAISIGSRIYRWMTSWLTDWKTVQSELKSVQMFQEELKLEVGTDELIAAIQATISEAENCYDSLNQRLAEKEKHIEAQQQNALLREKVERLEKELEVSRGVSS